MEYILTSKEMKESDRYTIEYFGIPGMVLMERAALAVCAQVGALTGKRVLVVCGSGNNGGDGFAIGRILFLKGYQVEICFVGKVDRLTEDAEKQMEIARKYNLVIRTQIPDKEYDIIIDAVVGIGLQSELDGHMAEVVRMLNAMPGYKLAVDIPTGIHGDTGKIMGTAFKADQTVTFAFKKRGLLLPPANEYAGEIICADIGITEHSLSEKDGKPERKIAFSYQLSDLERIPVRSRNGNKGSFGKILMIAGSEEISGALILAVRSAYQSGAGYVRALTPECNREILGTAVPEALITTFDKADGNTVIETIVREAYGYATVTAIGPGMGMDKTGELLLKHVFMTDEKPLICDADGLNILARDEKYGKYLQETKTRRRNPIILTPHLGELSRLMQMDMATLKHDLPGNAMKYAREHGVILVCKDSVTLVTDGQRLYINQSGNEGMAKAGSGDVLTGILAGLLGVSGEQQDFFDTVCLGVYVHGLCGDRAKALGNAHSVMANDLIDNLRNVLKRNVDHEL